MSAPQSWPSGENQTKTPAGGNPETPGRAETGGPSAAPDAQAQKDSPGDLSEDSSEDSSEDPTWWVYRRGTAPDIVKMTESHHRVMLGKPVSYAHLLKEGMTTAEARAAIAADPQAVKNGAQIELIMGAEPHVNLDLTDLYVEGMTPSEAIDAAAADPRKIKADAAEANAQGP